MPKSQNPHEPFEGFDPPFYTQVPDALFDRFLPELSGAELKVVLYIVRRTFGFKKTDDNISISQLMNGITKRNGNVLDYGTGLSRDSVTRATKSLVDKGLIVRVRNSSAKQGDLATTYRLRMKGEERGVRKSDTGVSANRTGGVRGSDTQVTGEQYTEEQDIRIDAFLRDFSKEFRDRAPGKASITRASRLFDESGFEFDYFSELMYEARARTKKATNVKNRMSYWFAVLEQLLQEEEG